MKKNCFVLAIVFALMFSSCGYSQEDLEKSRSEGYAKGYSDGRYDCLAESEIDINLIYEEGYNDGYTYGTFKNHCDIMDELHNIIEDAETYVSDNSEWSLYEAMQIVGLIHGYMVSYDPSEKSTQQEYYDAIDSLYLFAEYFDSLK